MKHGSQNKDPHSLEIKKPKKKAKKPPRIFTAYKGPGGKVTIPADVNIIGVEAFEDCTNVTEVVLQDGVREIRARAFSGCSLRRITLPATLKKIDESAFEDSGLESIEIPNRVTEIGAYAFAGCKDLKTVRLSKGIRNLSGSLFSHCTSLREISIPEYVETIECRAFLYCAALETILFPQKLGCIGTAAFCGCRSLKEAAIGNLIQEIGDAAFKDCDLLENVPIPESLQKAGCDVFEGSPRVKLTGPKITGDGALIMNNRIVYCPPGIRKLTLPEEITYIKAPFFESLTELEELELPRGIQKYDWDWDAFFPLVNLKRIITDRDDPNAMIAMLLDVECADREGRPFTFKPPEQEDVWSVFPEYTEEYVEIGMCIEAHHRKDASAYNLPCPAVIIPSEIDGLPVTGINADAIMGDTARAYYIPDSVKCIEEGAFVNIGQDIGPVFIRLPKDIEIAEDAFKNSNLIFSDPSLVPAPRDSDENSDEEVGSEAEPRLPPSEYAKRAANDPTIGTGTAGRRKLDPDIWKELDSLNPELRIVKLMHIFRTSCISIGTGWCLIKMIVDLKILVLRISYIGASPADFRRFAKKLADGEQASFGWSDEPGWYEWTIQRRGDIFYVTAPRISNGFFISRAQFLDSIAGLDAEW